MASGLWVCPCANRSLLGSLTCWLGQEPGSGLVYGKEQAWTEPSVQGSRHRILRNARSVLIHAPALHMTEELFR